MSLMWMRKPHQRPACACAAGLQRTVTMRGAVDTCRRVRCLSYRLIWWVTERERASPAPVDLQVSHADRPPKPYPAMGLVGVHARRNRGLCDHLGFLAMGARARSACHRDLCLGRYSHVLVVVCSQGTRSRSSGSSDAGVRCVHRMLVDSWALARRAELPGMRRTARVLRLQAPHRGEPVRLPRVRARRAGPCAARDDRVIRPRARSASAEPCGSTAFMGATTSSSAESTCCRTHTRHYWK